MSTQFESILSGLSEGSVVPYLGPGALNGVLNPATGSAIPADSDSLILAMNNGQPMAPKLMFEFPRAAMNVELNAAARRLTAFLTPLTATRSGATRHCTNGWRKAGCLTSSIPTATCNCRNNMQRRRIP